MKQDSGYKYLPEIHQQLSDPPEPLFHQAEFGRTFASHFATVVFDAKRELCF